MSRLDSAQSLIDSLARDDRPAFIDSSGSVDWGEWLGSVDELARSLERFRGFRVGFPLGPTPTAYALFAALATLGCDVFLLDDLWTDESLTRLELLDGLDVLIDPDDLEVRELREVGRGGGGGKITIFTSGSTGLPKPVAHDWNTLTRPVRRGPSSRNPRWLLTYRPHLYAGLQVFFQSLLSRGTLVLPDRDASADQIVDLMQRAEVGAVSATPSYWRRLLMHGNASTLKTVKLEQITLGGEVTDQTLLDTLKRFFSQARIVHIYATSELGRCFSVKDGLEGFPASYLENLSEDGVELKVEDGELLARSLNGDLDANRSSSKWEGRGAEGWIATGDLVERHGDRFVFTGRKSDIINVGGNKVQPLRVEQVILVVPGVRDVRVFARRSSLVGQMVACEFVVHEGHEPGVVEREIARVCRESLASHEVPRFLASVPKISLSDASKKIRGAQRGDLSSPGQSSRPTE